MGDTLNVFISATSGDLGTVRELVKQGLLTMRCLPVEQANFTPDYREVAAMLEERIRGCEAVIHLVGLRYGAEPDPASLPAGVPEPDELAALQRAYRQEIAARSTLHSAVGDREEVARRVRELQLDLEKVREGFARQRRFAFSNPNREDPIKAAIQDSLGYALLGLGVESGPAESVPLITEAITSFRASLSVKTDSDVRKHLATGLSELGQRTSGAEGERLRGEAEQIERELAAVEPQP